ncbi:unnamed protein product [Toxocara canis]|uniref:BMERB domain-containing protein n=1 Tax=Toxocara canis TaxID=6265 RepID=A0A183VGW8_TOXCA|nr:unnamed protein product [Toxocara canis]
MKISDYFSLMPAVFEIKQLMGMISNEADREELAMLDKDRLSTRSEIKEKVDRIVARQPVEIQDAYLGILRKKIAQDDEQYETEIQELKEQGSFVPCCSPFFHIFCCRIMRRQLTVR